MKNEGAYFEVKNEHEQIEVEKDCEKSDEKFAKRSILQAEEKEHSSKDGRETYSLEAAPKVVLNSSLCNDPRKHSDEAHQKSEYWTKLQNLIRPQHQDNQSQNRTDNRNRRFVVIEKLREDLLGAAKFVVFEKDRRTFDDEHVFLFVVLTLSHETQRAILIGNRESIDFSGVVVEKSELLLLDRVHDERNAGAIVLLKDCIKHAVQLGATPEYSDGLENVEKESALLLGGFVVEGDLVIRLVEEIGQVEIDELLLKVENARRLEDVLGGEGVEGLQEEKVEGCLHCRNRLIKGLRNEERLESEVFWSEQRQKSSHAGRVRQLYQAVRAVE